MKLIAPDYYPLFHCIAGECRHTCCVGWEIDIDEDALAMYRTVPGELGRRLAAGIAEDGEGAHFCLTAEERCPFLNREGLCELILGLGEDSLCQVCADHPRFRSFLSDRTEIGLGLCCEAAARLVLLRQEPMRLITLEEDGGDEQLTGEEQAVLEARDGMLAIIRDRARPMAERMSDLCRACGVTLPGYTPAEWADLLLDLERLDGGWTDLLMQLREAAPERLARPMDGAAWEVAMEQLMAYLIFRHVAPVAEDGDLAGRKAFAVASWHIIRDLCLATGADVEGLTDIARMYSSEIEYSDENIGAIIEACVGAENDEDP